MDIKTEKKGIAQKKLFNLFIINLKIKTKLKRLNDTMNSFNGRIYKEKNPRKIISIIGKCQNELASKDKIPLIKSSSNIENKANRTTVVSISTQRKNNSREYT